jgi:peptide/nickel transport system substrate-binding protein
MGGSMKHGKVRWAHILTGLVLVFALVASGCGSDGDDATDKPSDGDNASEINRDGTVRVAWDVNQNGTFNLDPHAYIGQTSQDPLWYLVYGRLMRRTETGEVVPDLAEKVTITDPNTIDIKLREGLKWHDGTPYDAQSVKTGWEYTLSTPPDKLPNFTAAFTAMEGIEIVSPLELKLSFPAGDAAAFYDTILPDIRGTVVKPGKVTAADLVGAGPFKLTSYTADVGIDLERFEDYWNVDKVNFAAMKLVHVVTSEPAANLAALQAGQVDLATVDPSGYTTLSGDLKQLAVSDPNRLPTLNICKRDGALADVRVRKALAKAINRDELVEAVTDGTGEAALTFWPEGHPLHFGDLGKDLAYDPEGAKKLLKDAAQENLKISMYALEAFQGKDVSEVIKAQFAKVGVDLELHVTNNFVAEWLNANPSGSIGLIPGSNANPTGRLTYYTGETLANICDWADPEFDEIFTGMSKVSAASAEATDLWEQATEYLNEKVPGIPLYFGATLAGYDSSKLVMVDTPPNTPTIFPNIYAAYMKK